MFGFTAQQDRGLFRFMPSIGTLPGPLWGVAWREYDRDGFVIAPIPLNVLVWYSMLLMSWLNFGCLWKPRWMRSMRSAYRAGWRKGRG